MQQKPSIVVPVNALLKRQSQVNPWGSLASQPGLISEFQNIDSVSENKVGGAEERHLRLTSDQYTHEHTCTHICTYMYIYTYIHRYTQKFKVDSAWGMTLQVDHWPLHICIHMHIYVGLHTHKYIHAHTKNKKEIKMINGRAISKPTEVWVCCFLGADYMIWKFNKKLSL